MSNAAHALTQQFLAWAWRRSCPHLSIWEDAIADGLIQFESGSSMREQRLMLTARGQARLRAT
jgi:hypothetical protein